jgi:FkbM family methyltransferase
MIRQLAQSILQKHPSIRGLKLHLETMPVGLRSLANDAKRSWSQHSEDEWLLEELVDLLATGFYVDVGANHPLQISNTYRLYASGMKAICIEPNSILGTLHRRFRPEDILLQAIIGERNGVQKFFELGYHGTSTPSEEVLNDRLKSGGKLIRTTLTPVLRLDQVLKDCAIPNRPNFALLSVDTEGWDELVLRSSDWDTYRPRIVLVEANDEQAGSGIKDFMATVGYTMVRQFGVNLAFKQNSDVL